MTKLTLQTASAHWGWDEHRYFGQRVFEQLAGQESLSSLTALSVLGRRLSPDECAVLDDAAACLTLADPRIWPLKLTRVIAAHGGTTAAAAAGLLIEEEARIGPWACAKSGQLLLEINPRGETELAPGHVEAVLRSRLEHQRFVWGFGTPFRKRDERLVAFWKCLERRGRRKLPYVGTVDAIARFVTPTCHAEPNMSIAVAAVFLDLGVRLHEIGPLATALMQHMFLAHAVEGARQAPELLRRLPERCIRYTGQEARTSPRALVARAGSAE